MIRLILTSLILVLLILTKAQGVECSAVFTDGMQNNDDDGVITLNWAGQITNSPDNILDSNNSIEYNTANDSCDGAQCTNSGDIAESILISDFGSGSDGAINLSSSDGAQTFSPGQYTSLSLAYNADLTLEAGDYYFTGDFTNTSQKNIAIDGDSSSVVRIFVQGNVELNYATGLNESGSSNQLLLYANGSLLVGNAVTVSGFIYSAEDVSLDFDSVVNGAINAKNITAIGTQVTVNFPNTIPDICDSNPSIPTPDGYCETTFVNGATSWSDNQNGSIQFFGSPVIFNDKDGVLQSKSVTGDSGDSLRCEDNADGSSDGECVASGSDTQQLDIGDYVSKSSNTNVNNITTGITLGGVDYPTDSFNNVQVKGGGEVSFSSNYGTYYIKTFDILKNSSNTSATINFTPGEYHIGTLNADGNTTITISSPGEVRIIVENASSFIGNVKANIGGDPEDFLIYSEDDFNLEDSTEVHGLIYTENNADLYNNAKLIGAISSRSVRLRDSSEIFYTCDAYVEPDITPIVDYRFDECEYTGASGEVIDQVGSYNADTNNVPNPVTDAVINRSLNLSNANATPFEWLLLPKESIDNLDDFSISVWVKTDVSKSQQEIIHALGSSTSDDELELAIQNSNEVYFKVSNDPTTLSSSIELTDNDWHHLVVTRQGADTCLYVDGSEEQCKTNSVNDGQLDIDEDAVVIGQEQDSYGGGFDSDQSFDGHLDEFKVFDTVLNGTDVSEIYLNESSGKNYDGSDRANVSCIVAADTEYRFDELFYTGAAGEIIDTIAGANGQAIESQPIEGKVCNAIDLTGASTADYALLDNTILDKEDFTISLWAKTASSDNFGLLSGANSSTDNELLMWFDSNIHFAPHIKGQDPGNITMPNIDDDEWHHIVWTREGLENCLYFDASDQGCITLTSADTLNIESLILGQEQDSVGGSFSSSQDFVGLVDELVVFDEAISSEQISAIYANQNAGLGYDGSERICPSIEPILYMQFDEVSWSGALEEVIDETGSFNGQARNGATTGGDDPARVGNPGTCRYGDFNGTNQYVQVEDDDGLDITEQLTISTWIYPTKIPNSGLMTILSKDENYEFHVTSNGAINWWWSGDNFSTANNIIEINKWSHITITFQNNLQYIYVNGVIAATNTYSGTLPTNSDPLQIGQDQFFNGRYFQGYIDEVKIYSSALPETLVYQIYEETHPCDFTVDHFEIDAKGGQGLTCEPDNISITACSDPACSVPYTVAVDVVLSVSDGSGVVLNKDVTVVGGTVDVDYIHTTAEIVSLSLDFDYECINGSPGLCNVTFADAGFRFIDSSNSTSLPLQLSGKPSNTGYNTDTLTLEAVQSDDSGACAPLLVTGQSIDMAATYQAPTTGSLAVDISGVDIGMATSGTAFDSLPFVAVPLDFGDDTQHSAEFIFTYPDAGSVILSARYELPDDDGNPSGEFIFGSSETIVVRPFAFDLFVDKNLDVTDDDYLVNPGAVNASGDVFTVAADDIRVNTRAVVWKSGNDNNANGMADEGEDLTGNDSTSNFIDVSLTSLAHTRLQPTATEAVDGVLSKVTSGSFILGSQEDVVSYNEVGIIALDARYENYLSSGENIQGAAPYVGRFTPDHFTVTSLIDGEIWSYCDTGAAIESLPFAYSGQLLLDDSVALGYSTTGALGYASTGIPGVVIEARNKADVITENYIDDFLKLTNDSFERDSVTSGGVEIFAPFTDATQVGKDLTNLVLVDSILGTDNITDSSGEITYSYHEDDYFVYKHEENSEIIEFTADIDLAMISIIDSDDIATEDEDGDLTNSFIFTLNPTAPMVRFGRAELDNSYGPDTSDLPQTLSVKYFTDNGYKLSDTDTCTTFDSANITLTTIDLDPTKTPLKNDVTGTFADDEPQGETRDIILTAPTTDVSASNTGQVCVTYDVFPWLQYLWAVDEDNLQCAYSADDVDSLLNDNPHAIATFGLYRGNDRIIYQREIAK